MHNTPNMVCVWRHAEHTIYGVLCTLYFLQCTASLDQFNCPTFVLSTSSPCGAIPLGVVITCSESTAVVTETFRKLQGVLPEHAFYGKNPSAGPKVCITDDSRVEREALRTVWPHTRLLLCAFHYLQAWWRWLWGKENCIKKDDRITVINGIKRCTWAKTPKEFEIVYNDLLHNEASPVHSHPVLQEKLHQAYERKQEWAIAFRCNMLTRGNHTNNYAESGIRIIKDQIFERTKAYNLVQMFHFFTTTYELYYERRLLELAHNRISPSIAHRFYRHKDLPGAKAIQVTAENYLVKYDNETERMYHIDTGIGICTCPVGNNGQPCKHQFFVAQTYSLNLPNLAPTHSKCGRQQLALIAVGEERVMGLDFYTSIHEKSLCKSHDTDRRNGDEGNAEGHQIENPDDKSNNDAVHIIFSEDDRTSEELDAMETDKETVRLVDSVKSGLQTVFTDVGERLDPTNLDTNFLMGVSKFIERYNSFKKSSLSASNLSSAFHNFGKDTGNISHAHTLACTCTMHAPLL